MDALTNNGSDTGMADPQCGVRGRLLCRLWRDDQELWLRDGAHCQFCLRDSRWCTIHGTLILRHAPVQDHSVSCGWKPLRIKGSFGSFDSGTGAVHVILEGAFVKTVSR